MSTYSPEPTKVAAVVLAAGEGSRFAGRTHKLLTKVNGTPLARHAIDAAVGANHADMLSDSWSGFEEIIVVDGAVSLESLVPDGVTLLRNEQWQQGQATSLRAAVAYAQARGYDAIVVGLADQPGVPSSAWVAVASVDDDLAAADFGDGHRPPVRLSAAMWPSLPVSGDEGARRLLRARPEMVKSVVCDGDSADVDTLEDLRRWT